MTVELNHIIIFCRNKEASAKLLTSILGLPAPEIAGPFLSVSTDNKVTLDFLEVDREIQPQHYAFLVEGKEFDASLDRIKDAKLKFWADPFHRLEGQINTFEGRRGVYFKDPDGHSLEILSSD